jgi:hypothetical protein
MQRRWLKRHLSGLLVYTTHRITNAVAEATNATIQYKNSLP